MADPSDVRQEWRFNRVGVTPDVVVAPTPDDEAAGRDPPLQVALAVLRHQTAATHLQGDP